MSELLALTYGLASLALKDESDQDWLVRRFAQMYDMLNETRAYQELIQKGMVEGLEKGVGERAGEGIGTGAAGARA